MSARTVDELLDSITADNDGQMWRHDPSEHELERVITFARTLERERMTLALRLYVEHPDSFAPETREVMERMELLINAKLQGAV